MKLPKYLTTVTNFSKLLAFILFIYLPILGFDLGMKYGKLTNIPPTVTQPVINKTVPIWNEYRNNQQKISINYPSDINLITEEKLENGWQILFANNSLYSFKIEILDGTTIEIPYKGKIKITEDNFELFQQSMVNDDQFKKGYIRSRPTLKNHLTILNEQGFVYFSVYDYNRLISITAVTHDLKKIPYATLDKVISSFKLL